MFCPGTEEKKGRIYLPPRSFLIFCFFFLLVDENRSKIKQIISFCRGRTKRSDAQESLCDFQILMNLILEISMKKKKKRFRGGNRKNRTPSRRGELEILGFKNSVLLFQSINKHRRNSFYRAVRDALRDAKINA